MDPRPVARGERRNRRPKCGPYGEVIDDPETGRWRVRLTAAGKQFCADQLEMNPDPIKMLSRTRHGPGLLARCRSYGVDLEDVRAACIASVARTAVRWDPTRSAFSTALAWTLRGEVADMLKTRRKNKTITASSLDAHTGDESFLGLIRDHTDETEPVDYADLRDRVKQLPDRLRSVITLRFGLDGPPRTLGGVGEAHGFTRERARQLINEGLERLRTGTVTEEADVRLRREILFILSTTPHPQSARILSGRLRIEHRAVRKALELLQDRGSIVRVPSHGKVGYTIPRNNKPLERPLS